MQEDVRVSLEQVSSKVSLTLNFWTSYEQVTYVSVTSQWIDESWSFHKMLLDICRVSYPCEGPEIYSSLLKVLKLYNLEHRTLCCTHDNSQNAIHACHRLKEDLDGQKLGPFCFIPCAARALNLIIEDGLRTLKPVISKVREFAQEVNASKEIADDFIHWSTTYKEASFKLPIDASARWSGNYHMLQVVSKAAKSMDAVVRKNEETFGGRMLLSAAEKNAATLMHKFLDLDSFYRTTNDMCGNRSLTVGLALLFMENISDTISACQKACHSPDWLRNAAEDMAKKTRSYNNQVCNVFTYMTAILDPRIKTEYLPESINLDTFLEEARNHFMQNYSSAHFPSLISGCRAQEVEDGGILSFAEEIARRKRRASVSNSSDELTQYISEPIAPMQTDVFEWWKVNRRRYPRLSVMARDFLAVQAASVSPEELFGSKGNEVDRQRFCLSHDCTRATLCVTAWVEAGMKLKFRSSEIDYESLMEKAGAATDNGAAADSDKKLK